MENSISLRPELLLWKMPVLLKFAKSSGFENSLVLVLELSQNWAQKKISTKNCCCLNQTFPFQFRAIDCIFFNHALTIWNSQNLQVWVVVFKRDEWKIYLPVNGSRKENLMKAFKARREKLYRVLRFPDFFLWLFFLYFIRWKYLWWFENIYFDAFENR